MAHFNVKSVIFTIILLLMLGLTGSTAFSSKKENYAPGELIIKLKQSPEISTSSSASPLDTLLKKHKAKKTTKLFKPKPNKNKTISISSKKDQKLENIYHVIFPENTNITEVINELKNNPEIEYAEPNYIYETNNTFPSDPLFPNQWSLNNTGQTGGVLDADVDAPEAWDISTGSGVIVAVIDTGVAYDHEDLSQNIWENTAEKNGTTGIDDDGNGYTDDVIGWDFVTRDGVEYLYPGEDGLPEDNDPMDFQGHGTHVSGIVAAAKDNGVGVSGVAPDAKIMALRAGYCNSDGNGSLRTTDICNALYYAANNGAHIINMSFGLSSPSTVMESALNYADSNGCLLIASAGNSGTEALNYPAAYSNVIAVASIGHDFIKASTSTYGTFVDISAPGASILSTYRSGINIGIDYATMGGTSMAAPMVCGIAALIKSNTPGLTSSEIKDAIKNNAVDIYSYNPAYVGKLGTGLINAFQSIAATTSPNISLIDILVDDSYGNGDGIPDPGETITLALKLKNTGGNASNVTAVLTSSDPNIIITNNSETYGSLSSDEEKLGIFAFDINSNCPIGQEIQFNLTINDASYEKVELFSIDVGSIWEIKDDSFNDSSPAIADLDNDGFKEVVIGTKNGNIYVFDHEGKIMSGWPVHLHGVKLLSPALGDLDNDGDLEIVFNSQYGMVGVYHHDGTSLSGWPKDTDTMYASPVLADANNDGYLDIILAGYKKLTVYDRFGTMLPGWPYALSSDGDGNYFSTPAVADIDSDGYIEIIFGSQGLMNAEGYEHTGRLYVLNHDGTEVSGFPILIELSISSPPVLGDIDNDGDFEIVVPAGENPEWRVFAWHHDGSQVNGWPINIEKWGHDTTLADLDNNGNLEIITPCYGGNKVYAWKHTGEPYPGWPVAANWLSTSNPIVCDIDNDGQMEIIGAEYYTETIRAWNIDGSLASGWPKSGEIGTISFKSAPTAADIDNDGLIEIICAKSASTGSKGKIHIFETSGTYSEENIEWAKYHHDNKNKGVYPIGTDTFPPTINHAQPTTEVLINESILITAEVTDRSGVSDVLLHYSDVDGNPNIIAMASFLADSYSAEIPAQAKIGTIEYSIEAKDSLNYTALTGTYTMEVKEIDITPPDINHFQTIFEEYTGKTITITIEATDDKEIDYVKLNYFMGEESPNMLLLEQTGDVFIGTIEAQNQASTLTYSFEAADTSGNITLSGQYNIEIFDIIPPTIDHIPDAAIEYGVEIDVTATITDNIGVNTKSAFIYYNASSWGMGYYGDTYYGTIAPQYNLGTFVYTIEASDINGNTTSETYETQIIDSTDPVIIHDQTIHEKNISQTIALTVEATDNVSIYYVRLHNFMNGGSPSAFLMEKSGDIFIGTIEAQSQVGTLTYYFEAADESGNITLSTQYTIDILENFDTTPPVISHTQTINEVCVGATMLITVEVTDETELAGVYIEYIIDNEITNTLSMDKTGNVFSKTIDAQTQPCTLEYRFFAEDSSSNFSESEMYYINVIGIPDTTPPTIIHNQITEQILTGQAININAEVFDDIAVTAVSLLYKNINDLNFTEIPMPNTAGNTYSAIIPEQNHEGILEYKIKAEDTSGNIITEEYSVTIKRVNPVISAIPEGESYCYPNPYSPKNGSAKIAFVVPEDNIEVEIYIYNMNAQLIWKEKYLYATAGEKEEIWNGKTAIEDFAANGIYLIRVINSNTRKMLAKGKIWVITGN